MGTYIEVLGAAADKATPKCPDRAVDMAVPPLVDRLTDVKVLCSPVWRLLLLEWWRCWVHLVVFVKRE